MEPKTYIIVYVVLIAFFLGYSMYRLYKQQSTRNSGESNLFKSGYEHVFSGFGDNFIAFDTERGAISIGQFSTETRRTLPVSQLYNFEWKWVEREARKSSNRFIFYLSDVSFPMHEIYYYGDERKAEYEWAKLQAVYRTALATQYIQVDAMERQTAYDFFISHASEDKVAFVRPLVNCLQNLGLKVWYDEFTLEVGDSLRRSIDSGLTNSTYGIVVLSKSFFEKQWPQYELDGLVTKSMEGRKVILPVWHGINHSDVAKYSPSLAEKVAFSSTVLSVDDMAREFLKLVQKKVANRVTGGV